MFVKCSESFMESPQELNNSHNIYCTLNNVLLFPFINIIKSFSGVLIGSKSDLKERRVVKANVAQDYARKNNLRYFECSAVSIIFTQLYFTLKKTF